MTTYTRDPIRAIASRVTGPYINNAWQNVSGRDSLEIFDPSTGEQLGSVPTATAEDVDNAVRAAKAAKENWAKKTPGERSQLLLQVADLIENDLIDVAAVEAVDAGKPISAVIDGELPEIIDGIRFYAGASRVLDSQTGGSYLDGISSTMRREPVGIVAGITPWNYPIAQAMKKIAPALAVGNTVVLKPAETTPYGTALLAEYFGKVLPAGVFNLVFGRGQETGEALTRHPAVDLVSFTGSISGGRRVAEAAASGLKKTIMELGGNAPVIVFADADLRHAAQVAVAGGLYNTGQECMASSRLIVHESIVEEFTQLLVSAAEEYRLGDALDPETSMAAMNSSAQLERVIAKVDGRSANSTIELGGKRMESEGYFYLPTIITGLRNDEELVAEEIFGPVLTVQTFSSEDEALSMANGTDYGLAASVFTSNVGISIRVQNALDFGTIWVNNHLEFAEDLPVSGFGNSGIGTENSVAGILEMTRVKHIMTDDR